MTEIMKVLIYGHEGWIGQQFFKIISRKHDCMKGKSRVDKEDDVRKELQQHEPTHVISFIGRTHGKIKEKEYSTIDYLEHEGKLVENIRDNLYAPFVLSMLCKEKNIHFTYLGTGCIFEYDANHPVGVDHIGFTELDLPNFFGSSYSIIKGFTDRMMHMFEDNTLNLRIRMPITGIPNKRNFITKILSYEKICSVPNSMSVLSELLPYVIELMELKKTGTINFTNPGFISHDEILQMYREIVNPNFTWTNFTMEEQDKILDSKRSNNFLETTKLQTLFPNIKNIKDSVRDCLLTYKKYSENRNILIIGKSGFIETKFIHYYLEKHVNDEIIYMDVSSYNNLETNNANENMTGESRYHFIDGSSITVRQILYQYNITNVLHFASLYSLYNIVDIHILLEECRKYNQIQKFILVSKDTADGKFITHSKEMIKSITNPTINTKTHLQHVVDSYSNCYNFPITITTVSHVFGESQYPEKLIPTFINRLLDNKKITIKGEGTDIFSFLHISDVVKAFDVILEKGEIGEMYHICADENMKCSVLEIATILVGMIHPKSNVKHFLTFVENEPFPNQRYNVSNETLKKIGWNIEKDFYEGIREVISSLKKKKLNVEM